MRVGILKAGNIPAALEATDGSYPDIVRMALGGAYTYFEFDMIRGNFPPPESGIDAYVITGSASGVHDSDPWIDRLRRWLRAADPATPLVGICFGHQIMADAYGGSVETSAKGWGIGFHEYNVATPERWMDDVTRVVLPVTHRDQVVQLPAAARVILTSDFCPYAALSYTDRRAVSFQSHPELSADFMTRLIEHRQRNGTLGVAQAEEARASMRQRDDRALVMTWIRRFLDRV